MEELVELRQRIITQLELREAQVVDLNNMLERADTMYDLLATWDGAFDVIIDAEAFLAQARVTE